VETIIKNDKKTINAWAMYDWSNSVYALVIASAIFPAYYNQITRGADGSTLVNVFGLQIENTAIYSISLGVAFGIIALISPLVSSISDYSGNHKSFMKAFCYIGAAACSSLFFFKGDHMLMMGLSALMLATIGYSGSIVFYNSYLPAIATEDKQDKTSARGYAFGYIGASTLLILNLAAILNQKALGITDDTLLPRISFLLTGIWWAGFAQITFRKLPRGIYTKKPEGHYLTNGYRELMKVWHELRVRKKLRTFLFAFFFYIMGVQTVMFMAASFGEKEVNLGLTQLIITVLTIEYVGMAGAFLFAWLSKKFGNVSGLIIAVSIWILICVGSYFITKPFHFYTAGFFIGMVMGGIQSLSRSTYSKMIPKIENNAGFFSFYDVCEKMAMMCGLVMFGYLDNLTGSMRNSIFGLAVWFSIGLILLIRVQKIKPDPESISQA
jgi:UMF1 family MFS transporter